MAPGLPLDWPSRLIDRLQPPATVAARDLLPRRFLTGASLIGITVAVLSVASEVARGQWVGAAGIAVFGSCLALLLAGNRRGVQMELLGRACLALLAAFFTGIALLTVEIQYGQLKWLALLPLVALLLEGPPRAAVSPGARRTLLGTTTGLAALLGVFVVVAHQLGWTLGFHDAQTPESQHVEQAVDFVLFTFSVAGLLWTHRLALRRTEQELDLLRSMLSVCAWCKRIHDGEAGWIEMEQYMARRVTTKLTHGICPDCSAGLHRALQPHD